MDTPNPLQQIKMRERIVPTDIKKIADPDEASVILSDLQSRLSQRYPSRNYRNLDTNLDATKGLLYQAKVPEGTAGVVTGTKDGKHFFARALFVDPRYQGTNVARDLIESVKADFDEISMTSLQFGEEQSASRKIQSRRQTTLNAFYRGFGFVPQYPELEEKSNLAGSTLRMIWKKSERENI